MTRQITSAYWRPPWLRKSVLFGFMATFIVFSAGLILMWYLVNRYDGIPLILTTNHYAWTYGPTAVLTVVVSLWRQVNYCILVNQPWQELYHGPQNAAKTVLLDYMWPLQITSFIAALRNGHLAVAASIVIFTLLKLIMVISTTLFVLGNCSLSRDIQIRQLQKFDASKYFNSAGLGINITDISGLVWGYLNLQEGYRDASPPLELSTAFTGYSTTSEIPGGASKVTAPVDIFRVNVTCEPATVGWSQNGPSALFNLTLYAPSCDIGEIEIDACSLESGRCDSTVKHFTPTWVGCIGQGEPDANLDFSTTTDEYRFAIITIESDLSPAPDPDAKSYTVRVRRVAVVSCNLEYSTNQGVARGPASDTSQVDSLQVAETSSRAIDDLSKLELLVLISNSLGTENTITSEFSASLMSGSYFDLLGLLAGSRTITNTTLDPLLNASLLQSRAEEILAGLSHQLMRQKFLVPDATAASGIIDYAEQRLYTRAVALWAMVGLLVITSGLVIVVVAYVKQGVAPKSPSTLATAAHTISRSPTMGAILGESSAIRLSEIRKTLHNYDFVAVQDRTGMPRVEAIAVTRQEILPIPPGWLVRKWKSMSRKQTTKPLDSKLKKKKAWMPYSGHIHAIGLTITLPLIAIAILEVLWYMSEHDERFVTLSSESNTAYAIQYGSTATVLLITYSQYLRL